MNTHKRRRFRPGAPAAARPADIISDAVWLYYRFNPGHCDIENLLAEVGIIVSRKAIRLWCLPVIIGIFGSVRSLNGIGQWP